MSNPFFPESFRPMSSTNCSKPRNFPLAAARQEVTVWFADVRGFTEFTDQSQAKVLEYIREHNLSGAEAEAAINEEARETLATVNLYLGAIADAIKRHNGTLDKYIGDCAMAFWNAPIPNEKHAPPACAPRLTRSAPFTN